MSLRFSLALTLCLGSLVACGPDFRRGGQGESCGRTDDCEAPLVCIAMTCLPPGTTGVTGGAAGAGGKPTGGAAGTATSGGSAGAGGTTGGSGGAGGGGGTGGTGGTVLDPALCAACLDETCSAELVACDADCLAIEACLEVLCTHLSAIASPDEGQCQVHCQQEHPGAKATHLAVANCAITSSCGPCSSYPYDHDACVVKALQGPCSTQFDACAANADCKQYRDCVSVCGTLQDCVACGTTPAGMAGAPILLDYQQCIAAECIAESWLP